MTDPRRLLDDPTELSELEQRVLSAGASAEPGAESRREMWAALSAKLPPPGGGPGGAGPGDLGGPATSAGTAGTGGAVAQGAAWIGAVKAATLGVVLGGATMVGTGALLPSQAPSEAAAPIAASPRTPAAPVVAAVPPPEQAAAPAPARESIEREAPAARALPHAVRPSIETASAPAPEPPTAAAAPGSQVASFPVEPAPLPAAPAATPRPLAPPAPAPAPSAAVHEESRLIASARNALRAGDAGRALDVLEQARRRFPGGTLAQEREALSIEALAAAGRRDLARERARRFLDAHPSSFHAARVRPFAGR